MQAMTASLHTDQLGRVSRLVSTLLNTLYNVFTAPSREERTRPYYLQERLAEQVAKLNSDKSLGFKVSTRVLFGDVIVKLGKFSIEIGECSSLCDPAGLEILAWHDEFYVASPKLKWRTASEAFKKRISIYRHWAHVYGFDVLQEALIEAAMEAQQEMAKLN